MASSTLNLRTFTSGNVRVYSDPRVVSNNISRLGDIHQSKHVKGQDSAVTNRLAMNNANYEQSYPLHTKYPEKSVGKDINAGAMVSLVDSGTQPRQVCSTFRQPVVRKSGVIRIDAREYPDVSEPDIPVSAMSLPRAMNPLTNYPATSNVTSFKQTTTSSYLQRNASKTSLYAPSSISHMIATTTPPLPTSTLNDFPLPPPSSSTIVGSPSLRRQQSGNSFGVRGSYEYTAAGGSATLRRSHPVTTYDDQTSHPSFSNTLPYHMTARLSAQDKNKEGFNNETFSSSSFNGVANDNTAQYSTAQHVTFAPAQFSDPDVENMKNSACIEGKNNKPSMGIKSKDSASYRYPEKSKHTDVVKEKQILSKLNKKNLWILIILLCIFLIISVICLIYIATSNNKKGIGAITDVQTKKIVITQTSKAAMAFTTAPVKPSSPSIGPEYCLTENCVQSAGILLQKMNKSVDPCVDFYEYTCGGWISNNYMPADKPNYGVVSQITESNERILYESLIRPNIPTNLGQVLMGRRRRKNTTDAERKAQTFFRSCMSLAYINVLGPRPMLDMISDIGGWDALGTWNTTKWDLDELLYIIQGQQSISVLFSMSVQPDDANETRNILRIDPDGITLPDVGFYLYDLQQSPVVPAYKRLIQTLLTLLGSRNIDSVIDDIYGFEKKLAEIIATVPDEQEYSSDNMITIRDLKRLCPQIDWYRLLQRIIEKTSLSYDTKILVISKSFLGNLSRLLAVTPPRMLHNYMIWRAVVTKAKYLSTPFRKAIVEFSSSLLGPRTERPIWKECLVEVNIHFGVATGVMFVREAFSAADKRKVEEMARSIKDSFRNNLRNVVWMDDFTRRKAVEKLNAMSVEVGYQQKLVNNPNFLNDYYKFEVGEGSYFKNIMNSMRYKIGQKVDKMFNIRSKNEWSLSPQTMNAYYSPADNQVLFPAGLLQSPLYSSNFPMAINYGAIGSIIGHELTHGYDNLGAQYDKNGKLNPWWSQTSSSRFKRRSECIVRQYSKYSLGDLYVNGQNTLDENIADIAGLKVAYMAYKRWESRGENYRNNKWQLPGLGLTNDQVFFLGYAQTWCMKRLPASYRIQFKQDQHAPERFRVQGGVSQFKEFAKAFQCPPKTPMNPPMRCLVW